MAKIASGNVEIYVRQLLSEALGNDGITQNRPTDEKDLKSGNNSLTKRRLNEKSKDQ
ncbi:MAG: hypothetical protein AB1427_03235 [Thermodesulfobacteriota bacterium]